MPEIFVHCIEGPSKDQIKSLCEAITDAAVENLKCSRNAVVISVTATPRDMKSIGGVMFSER